MGHDAPAARGRSRHRALKLGGQAALPDSRGEHDQTAFSFGLVWDWAGVAKMRRCAACSLRGFGASTTRTKLSLELRALGEDFLSACLGEADFMRRVLGPKDYAVVADSFLPGNSEERAKTMA